MHKETTAVGLHGRKLFSDTHNDHQARIEQPLYHLHLSPAIRCKRRSKPPRRKAQSTHARCATLACFSLSTWDSRPFWAARFQSSASINFRSQYLSIRPNATTRSRTSLKHMAGEVVGSKEGSILPRTSKYWFVVQCP